MVVSSDVLDVLLAGQDVSGGPSDAKVRIVLPYPSLDCLLVRARLKYLRRLVCKGPRFLLALLSQKTAAHDDIEGNVLTGVGALDLTTGPLLEWSKLLACDLQKAYETHVAKSLRLPDPSNTAQTWYDFIRWCPSSFDRVVDAIFFTSSICDKVASEKQSSVVI